MHGDIDSVLEQRVLDLLGEHALTTQDAEGGPRVAVAGGGEPDEFADQGGVSEAKRGSDGFGLSSRQPAPASPDTEWFPDGGTTSRGAQGALRAFYCSRRVVGRAGPA